MVPPPKQSKWYNIYVYTYIVYTQYMATLGILYIYTYYINIHIINHLLHIHTM